MDIGTIDLGILIFLILFTSLWGFLGASRIVLTLTSVFVITTLIYNSPRFAGLFGSGLLGKILLSLFVLFLSLIFFGILARIIPSAIKGITKLGPYDKILGLIIGAILGIYICGFLVWGIEQYGGADLQRFIHQSRFAQSFEHFFFQLMAVIGKLFPQPSSPVKKT